MKDCIMGNQRRYTHYTRNILHITFILLWFVIYNEILIMLRMYEKIFDIKLSLFH
jgi:hypothetical protein